MRTKSATLLFCSLLGVAGLGACSSAEDGATESATQPLVACDPAAPVPQPIRLGSVVAVGEGADGKLYVASKETSEARVFISEGNVLQRVRVLGSGEGPEGYTLSFESNPPTRLVIKLEGGVVTGIALAAADERTFFDELPASATKLTIKDARDIANLEVRNLAGDVEIETVASVEGGAQLVVTRPRDDWSYEDFHIFYGTGTELVERVIDMPNAMPKSYRLFNFDVEGQPYTARITSQQLTPGVGSVLITPAGELPLVPQDVTAGLPAGVRFSCLR